MFECWSHVHLQACNLWTALLLSREAEPCFPVFSSSTCRPQGDPTAENRLHANEFLMLAEAVGFSQTDESGYHGEEEKAGRASQESERRTLIYIQFASDFNVVKVNWKRPEQPSISCLRESQTTLSSSASVNRRHVSLLWSIAVFQGERLVRTSRWWWSNGVFIWDILRWFCSEAAQRVRALTND